MSFNSNENNNIIPLNNLNTNNDKKYNLKKYNKIINHKTSTNLKFEQSPNISRNSFLFSLSDKKVIKLRKNINTTYERQKIGHLSNDDKKKLKAIVKNFDKNKVITKELFNQDKKLRLNSLNKTNYFFLIESEKKYNKNRKSKNKYISTKSRNINSKISKTDYSSSSMIRQFNNRTNRILDASLPEIMYSKNLNNFRKQIINNFNENIEFMKDFELSKIKYEDALRVLEKVKYLYEKRALETEKKFYKAKYNNLKGENNGKGNKLKKSPSIIKQIINDNFLSNTNDKHRRTREKTINLKNQNILSKLTLDLVASIRRNKKKLNSVIFNPNLDIIKNENNEIHRNTIKKINKKICYTRDDNYALNIKRNNDSKLSFYEKMINNTDINELMPEFYKIHDKNKIKRINERAKNYAASMHEINYLPYQPMKKSKNYSCIRISKNNLSRAIKINFIKKYLHNVGEDDLLLYNPKKLSEELLKTHLRYYKVNFKKKYNYSFLKKKLKPETIRKFGFIKDSYFGIPC